MIMVSTFSDNYPPEYGNYAYRLFFHANECILIDIITIDHPVQGGAYEY